MRLLLNSILLVFSMTAAAACLWGVSHLAWYYALPALIGFMLINNMPFAILHEAVHGVAARTA
ncbi:TPA: fatty acid desaturase, partial [Morganella morganii]